MGILRQWQIQDEILTCYVSAARMADVHSKDSGEEQMKKLLGLAQRPDGVFAYNDPMAIGAIHAILDAGLRIPEDVA